MQNRQKIWLGERLLIQVFKHYDHFTEAVGSGDWSMTMCAPDEPIWRLDAINLAGTFLQHGYLGSGNITEGRSDPGGTLFYIPLSDWHSHQTMNGAEFDSRSCLIFEPGIDLDLCIRGRHEWCSIFVPTRDVSGSGDRAATSNNQGSVRRLENGDLCMIGNAVRTVMSTARSSPAFESSPAGEHAGRFLQEWAGRIANNPTGRELPRPANRRGRPRHSTRDIIVRCRNALEKDPRTRLCVSDLVKASHISERTLRSAFISYYGVSPGRYLQLRLINIIHQDLVKADPEADSVTRILLRRGVWEFGRFATRYRRLYGEVPSATLRSH